MTLILTWILTLIQNLILTHYQSDSGSNSE